MDEILDVLDGGRDVYMLCDGEHGPDWLAAGFATGAAAILPWLPGQI